MSLDFPASALALWALSDACGVRPEYLLPLMALESAGFQSAIQNMQGADHWGLIQIGGGWLKARGMAPSDLGKMLPSEQITRVVQPYVCDQVRSSASSLKSGIRVYQSVYLPATLSKNYAAIGGVGFAPGLTDVMVKKGEAAYDANAGFDSNPTKGWIIPGDLGAALTRNSLTPGAPNYAAVSDALRQTYALRPSEKMQDPVFGEDFIASPPMPLVSSQKLQDWAAIITILGGASTLLFLHAQHGGRRAHARAA